MTIDIFEQGKVLSIKPFYMKDPSEPETEMAGSKIQGTYIGVERDVEIGSIQYPQIGNKYHLLTPDGIRWVGFSSGKRINEDMKMVKFGQIIGFKHFGKGKMKNGKSFNDIKIIADPKIIDNEWLAANKDSLGANGVVESTESDPEIAASRVQAEKDFNAFSGAVDNDEAFVSESSSPESKLKEIADLAKAKLGVIDPMTVKESVMKTTGLAFIESNYMSIINMLRSL